MEVNCSGCGGRHLGPGGKYCKFLQVGSSVGAHKPAFGSMATTLTEEERQDAIAGDHEEVPDRGSQEYITFLEDRIADLTNSVKDMTISQRVKDTENRLFSLYHQYKSLETSMTDKDGRTGDTGGHAKPGTPRTTPPGASSHPSPWSSIHDLIELSGGELGKLYPHNHVENSHWDKLSFREFILGLCRVTIYLDELNVPSLLHKRHVEFILEMAASNVYTTEAFLRYDHYVSTLVVEGKLHDWVPSHSHAQNLYFNRVYSFEHVHAARKKSGYSYKSSTSPPKTWWLENWPAGICYCYNWRSCNRIKCNNRHECVECGGDHTAMVCAKQPVDPVTKFGQQGSGGSASEPQSK